jgi:hypothetical protein
METVRDMLIEQARKDIAKFEREFDEEGECGDFPKIVPRSEAIISLREVLARELIRPDGKGFVFEGFKGLNKMTNQELSERLSTNPPPFNYIVWDDGEFHLLFGDRCQANHSVLSKLGLWNGPPDA